MEHNSLSDKFEWVTRPQLEYTPLYIPPKVVPPILNRNEGCVRWRHSPETIEELLQIRGFLQLLRSGIVFIHYKNPSSYDLIYTKLKQVTQDCSILNYKLTQQNFKNLEKDRWQEIKETTRKTILIIDLIDPSVTMNNTALALINDIRLTDNFGLGVWIRGTISELKISTIPFSIR